MPNDLFDQDRLLWRIMSRIMDIILLGFMWTVTSLPVITIGASSSAVYYVVLKMARNEEGYLWKGYWKAFRQNFKQATVLWLILLAAGAFFSLDIYYFYQQKNPASNYLQWFLIGLMVLLVIVIIYIFPIISRFSNSNWNMIKMAVFMPFKHFGWTLLLVAGFAADLFLAYWIIPFGVVAYGVYAYASAYIFVRIFKPYEAVIRKQRGETTDNNKENNVEIDTNRAAE